MSRCSVLQIATHGCVNYGEAVCPREIIEQLICQCCGMPLNEDNTISREPDGSLNEDYCKWCYADGKFAYQSKDALIDFLIGHMPNTEELPEGERRSQYDGWLSKLEHWK